jgi:protein-serine/threonine kinase
VSQIINALQYIHGQDILHNDLRLSNLMVTANGLRVKLIDFGLAKLQKADMSYSAQDSSVRSAKYKCPTAAR